MRIGLTVSRIAGFAQIDEKNAQTVGLALHVFVRRGSHEKQHQIGVLHARGPHFLSVDDVVVALTNGHRLNPRRVRSGVGFGDAERLQTQLPTRNPRKIAALLFRIPVTQYRSHRVHLRVRCYGGSVGTVDRFQNDRSFRNPESAAAVLFGDEDREPTTVGQRFDEFLGIFAFAVERRPIVMSEAAAQLRDGVADCDPLRRHGQGE